MPILAELILCPLITKVVFLNLRLILTQYHNYIMGPIDEGPRKYNRVHTASLYQICTFFPGIENLVNLPIIRG